MEISGVFDFLRGENTFCCLETDSYKDGDYDIEAIGENDEGFSATVSKLYKNNPGNLVNSISGMFLAAIYDKKNNELIICSDITTSWLTLYYAEKDGMLFYSTSLKKLLLKSGIKRSLNLEAAKHFSANGYIYGQDTLINSISKLSLGNYIRVDKNGIKQKKIKYELKYCSEEEGKSKYQQTISATIKNMTVGMNKVFMPLSGGYDSNCILSSIREFSDLPVHAFTIGSKTGTNEIPVATKIVDSSKNIELDSCLLEEEIIQTLPDVIWRLDGAVYETGIFLQYELAKLVKKANGKNLICGESNNETQSLYYYQNLKSVLSDSIKLNAELSYTQNPFIATNLMVLKKSSIMLNSFGIKGLYPYKDTDVVACADSVKALNANDRAYFKEMCKKIIPEGTIGLIQSTGGTTGIKSFITNTQFDKLVRFVNKNAVTKKIKGAGGYVKFKDNALIHFAKKIWYKLKYIYTKDMSYADESYLRYLYIIVFNELFISGNYDSTFEHDGIEFSLQKILQKMDPGVEKWI